MPAGNKEFPSLAHWRKCAPVLRLAKASCSAISKSRIRLCREGTTDFSLECVATAACCASARCWCSSLFIKHRIRRMMQTTQQQETQQQELLDFPFSGM